MVADILDAAADLTTEMAERSIREICAQAAKIDTSNESGLCWQCDSETGNERRFCDAQCRDFWSKEHE